MSEKQDTGSENPAAKYLDRLFERRFGPLEKAIQENGSAVLRGVQEAVQLMASLQAMQNVYEHRTQEHEREICSLKERVTALESALSRGQAGEVQ